MKILIADVSAPARKTLSSVLRTGKLPVEIIECDTFEGSFAALLQPNIDCAVINTTITEPETINRLDNIRTADIQTPIILIGPDSDEQHIIELLKAGATDYLANQQVTADLLRHSIGHAIRLAHAEKETRQAKSASRKSEEKFNQIYESNVIGVVFAGADGTITKANDAYLKMLGYTQADLATGSLTWKTITPPEHIRECEQAFKYVLEKGTTPPFEKEYFHKDGSRVSVLMTLAGATKNQQGTTQAFALTLDLTEKKRLEFDERKTQELLESVIQHSPGGIAVLDSTGLVRVWSPACERILGWKADEVIGKVPPHGRHRDSEVRENIQTVLLGGTIQNKEIARYRKDGSEVWLSANMSPMHDSEGRVIGIISISIDITESRGLKDQLIHSQRLESIGRLASGVAHDFNNLLAVITGYTEALMRRSTPGNSEHEHIQHIALAAERGTDLTRKLLTFSRGRIVKLASVNLNEVISPIHEMLCRVMGKDHNIQVKFGDQVLPVLADTGQLEQILFNLALNARDAMPTGGDIIIETANAPDHVPTENTRQTNHTKYVRLSVTDTGGGMDESTRSHIFEPFFTTKDRKGTGLGLWIVYSILQRCNATITVRSSLGDGTTFDIYFPAHTGTQSPESIHHNTHEYIEDATLAD